MENVFSLVMVMIMMILMKITLMEEETIFLWLLSLWIILLLVLLLLLLHTPAINSMHQLSGVLFKAASTPKEYELLLFFPFHTLYHCQNILSFILGSR